MTNTEIFAHAQRLVSWLDNANGDSEYETVRRLLKVSEETGEVMQAYIGMSGQNPRKGVTHTAEDVASELCDVMVSAAVALHSFSIDPAVFMQGHIASRTARLEELRKEWHD
jgi:NTP pyrophosphatase (non-canonical NTP hydrolase)